MSQYLPLFVGSTTFAVTVVTPSDGDSLTSTAVDIVWTFSPGVQADYRVVVYESDQTTVAYDSGTIAGATGSHTIPSGSLLNSQTYYVQVTVHTTGGDEGVSELIEVTTAWSTAVDVTGIAVSVQGDRCDTVDAELVLPGVLVSWSEVTPGGGETFSRYLISRRFEGETAWTVIAEVDAVDSTSYLDAAVPARVRAQYAVQYEAVTSSGTALSDITATGYVSVDFEFSYLHSVSDSAVFALLHSLDAGDEIEEEIGFLDVWGRRASTALIGEHNYARFNVEILPELHRKATIWDALSALRTNQRESVSTLMLRRGWAGDRYWCQIARVSRENAQKTHGATVELREVHYTEDLIAREG